MNQTINNSLIGNLTFDQAYQVTSSIPFVIALAVVWFFPILIYIIWGASASARTADGRKLSTKVINNSNFWIGFIIFALFEFALLLLIVFPVWLLPFS